jgi:hypothetical protein
MGSPIAFGADLSGALQIAFTGCNASGTTRSTTTIARPRRVRLVCSRAAAIASGWNGERARASGARINVVRARGDSTGAGAGGAAAGRRMGIVVRSVRSSSVGSASGSVGR